MDIDITILPSALEEAIAKSSNIAKRDGLKSAVESLTTIEKQSRLAGDATANTSILIQMATLCFEADDFNELESVLLMLSKKRSLVKTAVTSLVQKCIGWILTINDRQKRHHLIRVIRTITEGKIYLEVERAQVTRILANIFESEENKLTDAAQVMQDLQVETFGSMEKRAKVDFILEQIRLCIAVREYSKAFLIAKKVTNKTFEHTTFEDLKLKYLELMITLAVHDQRYIDCYHYYRDVFNASSVQNDPVRCLAALKMAVIFAILSPHTNEQKNMLNILYHDKKLEELPLYADFLRTFLTNELVRWPVVEKAFGTELRAFNHLFGDDEGSKVRWSHLADRVIEHNVRTISAYYTRITFIRFAALLELGIEAAEATLCSLIEKKMVYAKLDRTSGVITFAPVVHPDAILNSWSQKVDSLLSLMVKTNYQIFKEEMLYSTKQ